MDAAKPAKLCIYCGTENAATRQDCLVCHNELVSETQIAEATDRLIPISDAPDIAHLSFTFIVDNGFSYPDWKAASEAVFSAKRILTHELVHNCIAHLHVPTWLHEGLAQKLEDLASNKTFVLDGELAARHHAFWNETNIQEFWSGVSFYGPMKETGSVILSQKSWSNSCVRTGIHFSSLCGTPIIGMPVRTRLLLCLGAPLATLLPNFWAPATGGLRGK